MSINLTVTLEDTISKKLDKLGAQLHEHVLRSSARAGALVFYNAIHKNVPFKTGKMKQNIYHKFVKERETKDFKMYRIGVNQTRDGAPHLWWMEYGHIFYYAVRLKENGEFVTLVRPEKMGTTKPGRHASRSEKDAYYVKRKNGPYHWQGYGFIRKSYMEGKPQVLNAVVKRAEERFNELMRNKIGVDLNVD